MNPRIKLLRVFLLGFLLFTSAVSAQDAVDDNPLGTNLIEGFRQAGNPDQISTSLLIFFLLTILTLAPAILVMTTLLYAHHRCIRFPPPGYGDTTIAAKSGLDRHRVVYDLFHNGPDLHRN